MNKRKRGEEERKHKKGKERGGWPVARKMAGKSKIQQKRRVFLERSSEPLSLKKETVKTKGMISPQR